jgi:hypothetical protein
MTCIHPDTTMYQRSRVSRVPNGCKGRMLTRQCNRCRAWLPVTWPLGDATANDRIPGNERRLAKYIAETCILWEPGPYRESLIAHLVELWSGPPRRSR